MDRSAIAKAETIARSRVAIENAKNWPGGILHVRVHPWIVAHHAWHEGIIRAFDPSSVLLPNRAVDSFGTVAEVAEVWGPSALPS